VLVKGVAKVYRKGPWDKDPQNQEPRSRFVCDVCSCVARHLLEQCSFYLFITICCGIWGRYSLI